MPIIIWIDDWESLQLADTPQMLLLDLEPAGFVRFFLQIALITIWGRAFWHIANILAFGFREIKDVVSQL